MPILEVEYDPTLIPEVVGSTITSNVEIRVQIIDLGWPDGDGAGVVYRNIKAAAKSERKGIIRRSRGITNSIVEIRRQVGVRSSQ